MVLLSKICSMQAEDWDSSASSSGSCSDSNDEDIWNPEELTVCQHCGLLLAVKTRKNDYEQETQAEKAMKKAASVAAFKKRFKDGAKARKQWEVDEKNAAAKKQHEDNLRSSEQHRKNIKAALKKVEEDYAFWGSLKNKAKQVLKK
jgi:hypothetical protein